MLSDEHAYMKSQIRDTLRLKETEELLEIWQQANHEEWTDLAFEVVQEILKERLGEVPAQGEQEAEEVETEPEPEPEAEAPSSDEIKKFLRQQTYESMDEMDTEELVHIWREADREEWTDTAFEVVQQILIERLGEVPAREPEENVDEEDVDEEDEVEDEEEQSDEDPAAEVEEPVKPAHQEPPSLAESLNFVGMQCPDCGKAISEDDKLCPHCGVDLEAPLSEAELQSLAAEHFEKAQAGYDLGRDFKGALADCDLALEYTPDSARVHNLRGLILDALDKTGLAVRAYKEAVRLDPNFSDARDNLRDAEADLKSRKSLFR